MSASIVKPVSGEVAAATGNIEVKQFTDAVSAAWDRFVGEHPDGTFLHLTNWKRAIERAFPYQSRYLYAERGGRMEGILPLFLVKNPVIGKVLISTPFAVYGGICAATEEAHRALREQACRMAQELQVEHLELRCRHSAGEPGFHTKELYVSFDREMPADPEALLKSFPKDTRYMVRKGQKAGLTSEIENHSIDVLHDIYAHSVRNLGTPVFSIRFFRILVEEFGSLIENTVIRQGKEPIAAVMSFRFRDTIAPYYGGALHEARKVAANNFMYWEVMRRAIEGGLRRYDFGRSKVNTGAHFFKTQWGMDEKPLPYQFYLVRRKEMPNFSPANPRFKFAIEAWKRIPVSLAKLVGPPIIKLFP